MYHLIYLHLYSKIKEHASSNGEVLHSRVLEVLRRNLMHIPRRLHYPIIKELEELNLLHKINKQKYKLIGGAKVRIIDKYLTPI